MDLGFFCNRTFENSQRTGRTLYERSAEHLSDASDMKPASHIFKHWALHHPELNVQTVLKFKVLKPHKTPLNRQVHETIRITSHGNLNSKAEFRQNQVKRLAVSLTARELKVVERELEKCDSETTCALETLKTKLNKLNKKSIVSLGKA